MFHPFVVHLIGGTLLFLAGCLLVPLWATWQADLSFPWFFVGPSLVSGALGWWLYSRPWDPDDRVSPREGFLAVTLSWFVLMIVGALPYLLSGEIPGVINAMFESMSGFTTTGASILKEIEPLRQDVLFWRSMTHWIGGIGIIVMVIVILPPMAGGALALYKGESGLTPERLSPKLKKTGLILLWIYLGLTAAQTLLLYLGPMDLFDALCHTFGTVATGGFSTHTASISFFDSVYVEGVILLFMCLGGMNFALFYRLMRGRWGSVFRNTELRVYVLIILTCVIALALLNHNADFYSDLDAEGEATGYPTFLNSVRNTAFQVVSIMTTTGYITSDYERLWHPLGVFVILHLMVLGACAGSTGGGIKVARPILVVKLMWVELQRLIRPKEVLLVRIDGNVMESNQVVQAVVFLLLYFTCIFVGTVLCLCFGMNFVDGASSVVASMGSIGPGFGSVGARGNFADIPAGAKIVNIACMLLGRLEIFTILALLAPRGLPKVGRSSSHGGSA